MSAKTSEQLCLASRARHARDAEDDMLLLVTRESLLEVDSMSGVGKDFHRPFDEAGWSLLGAAGIGTGARGAESFGLGAAIVGNAASFLRAGSSLRGATGCICAASGAARVNRSARMRPFLVGGPARAPYGRAMLGTAARLLSEGDQGAADTAESFELLAYIVYV